jgi:hypothetical protein
VTEWRKILAGTLTASICLFGLTAQVDAAGKPAGKTQRINDWSRKSTDHPKLDRKLNDRSDKGGSGVSRVIVTLKPGRTWVTRSETGGKRGRKLGIVQRRSRGNSRTSCCASWQTIRPSNRSTGIVPLAAR